MTQISKQSNVLWILTILMLVNVLVSGYIEIEKRALLRGESDDVCFTSSTEGNCADVQLSSYGKFLGFSVSVLGVLAFSFMAVLLGSLAYSLKHRKIITDEKDIKDTLKFAGLCFGIATIGAVYFIVLQIYVIQAICKYCMVIDGITIVSAIIFFAIFKKGVDFYTS